MEGGRSGSGQAAWVTVRCCALASASCGLGGSPLERLLGLEAARPVGADCSVG